MAATMKHRRSSRRRKTTRGADRYDAVLTKFKKIKKFGGSPVIKLRKGVKATLSHRVTKENPTYKGVKVITSKED
ncbi:MAG: hypothetical protein Q9M91_01235 [Candidatus Dojkabacteria bacterium]|nr:hypothetical protein [Candidatus Dojkabacteria bacterium]MDQ7020447.1 hypothetical protein [Candidatus Dojkabacteria bacterium]